MNSILVICIIIPFYLNLSIAQLNETTIVAEDNLQLPLIGFLEGLPMEDVVEFVDLQLNRTVSKGQRDAQMKAWAKKQDKKIKKQFDGFIKRIKKEEKSVLKQKSKEIAKQLKDELITIYRNPNSSYIDVCRNLDRLAEKIADRVRAIGENGLRNHAPCSIDSKTWPANKIIRD